MKVLIVDDEPLVRRSLARVLRAKGHEVLEAEDGRQGLEQWRQGDPDLVFLDVLMPQMSGPEVLSNLPGPRRAKVILMSAFSGDQPVSPAGEQAADLFLPKPFEDVFEVVKKAEELCR